MEIQNFFSYTAVSAFPHRSSDTSGTDRPPADGDSNTVTPAWVCSGETCPSVQMKKNDNLPSCSSSSSSSSSWSNQHKLKLTARLLKLRRRLHRLTRIGFVSGSARREPITFGRCCKPRPPLPVYNQDAKGRSCLNATSQNYYSYYFLYKLTLKAADTDR